MNNKVKWAENLIEVKEDENDGEEIEKWVWKNEKEPTADETKKMLGYVIAEGVKTVFSTHVYEFRNHIYRQKNKGPIGLKASGSVSRLIMIWWGSDF